MPLSYLALGDSYTVGEQVPLYESFPYQLIRLLRVHGTQYFAPEIIARTGWTTDELMNAISDTPLLPSYDLVTLLIGVNNQYRGRTVENFRDEFDGLLKKAIGFSKNDYVIVLSIPDWGITPFAEGRDRQKIAQEIDAYNLVCKGACEKKQIPFIDITSQQRVNALDPSYLASDGLHPSGKEYGVWAQRLCKLI